MKRISTKLDYLTTDRAAGTRSLVFPGILVTALFIVSCIAAIPVAIKYAKTASQTKARAEMPVSAEKAYGTAVTMVNERADVKILKKDDDRMFLEVTDGVQTASLKAVAAGSEKSEITITASLPSQEGEEKEHRKAREKELTLRLVKRLCERLEVKCTIVKE